MHVRRRYRVEVGLTLVMWLWGLSGQPCLAGVRSVPVVARQQHFAVTAGGLLRWRPGGTLPDLPPAPAVARYRLQGGSWTGWGHRHVTVGSTRYRLPAGVNPAQVLVLPLAHGILWTVRPASTLAASPPIPPPTPGTRTRIAYTPYRRAGGSLATGAVTLGWLPRHWDFALAGIPTAWIAPGHRAAGVTSPAAAGIGPLGVPALTGIRGHAVVTRLVRVHGGAVIVLATQGNAMTGMPGYLFLFRERRRTLRPVTNFADSGGDFSWYAAGESALVWDHGFMTGKSAIDQQFLLDLVSGQWWMTPVGPARPGKTPPAALGIAVMAGFNLVVSSGPRGAGRPQVFVPRLGSGD